MIEFELSPGVLGNTRFAFSPIAEVGASLKLLGAPHLGHPHLPWLRRVRHRLEDVNLPLLLAVSPPGKWAPDFLYLPAPGPTTTIEEQAHELANMSAEYVHEELGVIHGGSLSLVLRDFVAQGGAGPAMLADEIMCYWHVAIHPYWQRMCAVLEDDVAYRASRTLSEGLFDLLNDLHPQVTVAGNRLTIDKPHHASAIYASAQLTLTPSVFVWPSLIVAHSRPGKFELTYAARGVARIWEGMSAERPARSALGALIGRSRANILTTLSVPMTTTSLSAELGLSPANISEHLTILRDAGMLVSWRSGRNVLYRRTPLAESVLCVTLNAQEWDRPDVPRLSLVDLEDAPVEDAKDLQRDSAQ